MKAKYIVGGLFALSGILLLNAGKSVLLGFGLIAVGGLFVIIGAINGDLQNTTGLGGGMFYHDNNDGGGDGGSGGGD